MQDKLKSLKPAIEKLDHGFGNSFRVKQYSDPARDKNPYWHIHEEMELIYINGGSGKRHIGNHLSYFQGGDLIFIGANLPHHGFTDRLTGNKSETMIQMKEDFLGDYFMELPEMSSIKQLFVKARRGVIFYGETKDRVGNEMEMMPDKNPFDRLLQLQKILRMLAESEEYTMLNIDTMTVVVHAEDTRRMRLIYDHVKENYQDQITLSTISDIVSMTEPAFCRFFKKMSGKTFTRFVNEYRMVSVSRILAETSMTISEASIECGFKNFSHFNKQFKSFTGKNPSQYRRELTTIL